MIEALHTNPTQLTGLLVFSAAAIVCARTGRLRADRLWFRVSAASAACTAEVAIGVRHLAHGAVNTVLQARGWYGSREPVQILLLAIALLLAAGTLACMVRMRHADANLRVASAAAAAALWLFLIEAISLHAVDAFMYVAIGPVLAIGWLWAVAALVVAVMALRATKVRRPAIAARRR